MKKYFFLAAAAAMMLSACSDQRELDYLTNDIPLTIGYSLGELNSPSANTRANGNDIQNSAILNDATNSHINAVGIFVLKEGEKTHTTTEKYERFNVTSTTLTSSNPTTGFTALGVATADALYYPESKTQKIDIYAYAPYKTGTVSDITTPFSINTSTDQTDIDDYMASDVLWGCVGTGTYVEQAGYDGTTGYTPEGPYHKLGYTASVNEVSANQYMTIKKNETSGSPTYTADGQHDAYYFKYDATGPNKANTATVVVPMLHRGSKIVVNLVPGGMEKSKLKNAVVKFNVDYTAGSLNMSTGEYSVTSGTATPAASTPITLTDHLGIKTQSATADEEGVATVTTANDAYTCSAVIVPQTLAVTNDGGDGSIITIDLKSDQTSSATTTATYAYKTNSTTDPEFESGKVYTYNITVQATGLTVTTSVSAWVDATSGTPYSGSAVLQ